MTRLSYVWLVCGVAVLVLDTTGALASRHLGFAYATLAPVSYIVYFCAGVGGGRLAGIRAGLVAGSVTALIEATIGWGISSAIGVGQPATGLGLLAIGLTVLMVVCTGAALGAVGGVVGHVVRRSLRADV